MKKRFFKSINQITIFSIVFVAILSVSIKFLKAADINNETLSSAVNTSNQTDADKKNQIVTMARATWDTGWFHAEIFKQLLEEFGYIVKGPNTMEAMDFFRSVAKGEVDLWTNGWFPAHYRDLEKLSITDEIEIIGYLVKAGTLQGYLIDKKSADKFKIKNLSDFKNPAIASIFDRDGNGKADLIGCDTGWGCAERINHHLEAYGLLNTIEHIQGEYSPMMGETISLYKKDNPVFFYTWTPNWTTGKLIPGKDVMWIDVPFPTLPGNQKHLEDKVIVKNISGCVSNPCAMGFPPGDIRIVANSDFVKRNPTIKRLAKLVVIPLSDIENQNAMMINGEDDEEDIQRHAKNWIQENRIKVSEWLKIANKGKELKKLKAFSITKKKPVKKQKAIKVVTKNLEPFVVYKDRHYTGFSVELWEKIADELNMTYTLNGVNSVAKLLDEVKRGAADIAIGGIGISSKREQSLDFSHSFFESGLQIMVPKDSETALSSIFGKVFSILFSPGFLYVISFFLVVLFIAANILWLLERKHNDQFSEKYLYGIWQSIWWAVVTVTTVGYGDKTPKGNLGRLFGLLWIVAGYFIFAYFTASVTTTVTVSELKGTINGPQDLFGKKIATVKKSPAMDYLEKNMIETLQFENIEATYALLETGELDAIVYDAPVLQHYALTKGKGKVKLTGLIFQKQGYGIALQTDSPYTEAINRVILRLIENGTYKKIHDKWFSS